jgi:hypothetical protein
MLHNVDQAKVFYPGWQVMVYHDDTVPAGIIAALNRKGAATVQVVNGVYGMFWRFYAADLADCGYVIFRDSDSRLSVREHAAVEEWMKSGKVLHVMRDHPYHQDPINGLTYNILGGMWGIQGNRINLTALINTYAMGKSLDYGSDQIFLNRIYKMFNQSVLIHDEFFGGKPFPVKRTDYRFVGERFNEDNAPLGDDWKVIKQFYFNKSKMGRLINLLKAKYRQFRK